MKFEVKISCDCSTIFEYKKQYRAIFYKIIKI